MNVFYSKIKQVMQEFFLLFFLGNPAGGMTDIPGKGGWPLCLFSPSISSD
jgi:hypothetical protein